MSVVKASGLEAFLRKPDPQVGLLLIYGDEPDAVRELAAKAVKRIAGSLDDPFSVVKLDDSDLSSDPARLVDEMQSISMLGGQRAIWIKGAGDGLFKASAAVLDGTISGNFIVAEAGALPKTSKLRDALEKSSRAIIVPLYEAEDGDIAGAIDQGLARMDLVIDMDAKARLAELIGSARGLMQREIEKLGLYAMGQKTVTLADVEAICGTGADADTDDLVDAVFTGLLEDTDRIFTQLLQGGTDAGRMLMVAHGHAQRLQDFRLAIDKGGRPDFVLKTARPPVFFKRQNSVQQQLKLWPMANLLQAATTLAAAVSQARLNAAMADSIASRALLGTARMARSLLSERL